jgi:hypothetical protein
MQIDFHHGVTYVLSRIAGFGHDEASIIAYAAQYVDDATNSGVIHFSNGWSFNRISSAHKMLDYRNFQELANHHVWIPFHFLPGNGGLTAIENPAGELDRKLICTPNSYVAQDLVRECIEQRHQLYALHRLGITMHVYADTWAHQGFMGINHKWNDAIELLDRNGDRDDNLMNRLKSFFVGEALPLGHGTVLSNPDKPFLKWGYVNCQGDRIMRDNPKDFLTAAEHLCMALQRYRLGNATAMVPGLPESDREQIADLFNTVTDAKGEKRHEAWLRAITQGRFSFGSAQLSYIAKGKGSWKYIATGTEAIVDPQEVVFPDHSRFLQSHWKLFHDALQAHRFYVLHELLPTYGICVA